METDEKYHRLRLLQRCLNVIKHARIPEKEIKSHLSIFPADA